jgi:hypothetical protein
LRWRGSMPTSGSNEGFSMVNGKKEDEGFHAPILDNKSAQSIVREQSREVLRLAGYTDEQIDKMLE